MLEEQQSRGCHLRSLQRGYSSQTDLHSTICPYPICRPLYVNRNIHIDRKIAAEFPGKLICDEHLQVNFHIERSITVEYDIRIPVRLEPAPARLPQSDSHVFSDGCEYAVVRTNGEADLL
ncbi:hypothetical protein D3C74_327370 [compost metagenome]